MIIECLQILILGVTAFQAVLLHHHQEGLREGGVCISDEEVHRDNVLRGNSVQRRP